MTVSVHLLEQSQPMEYLDVRNTYTKGALYCLYLEDGRVYKYPLVNIFRIEESYE